MPDPTTCAAEPGQPTRLATRSEPRSQPRRGAFVFVRVLRGDPGFALALAPFAFLAIVGLVLLPRVWTVTPEGLSVIRVSGLDLIQAWSRRRTARRAEAAGERSAARAAWEAAVAGNPADRKALEGMLHCYLAAPDPRPEPALVAAREAGWLLSLTRTNLADLDLALQVFGRAGFDESALSAGVDHAAELSDAAYAALTEAAFRQEDVARFTELWNAREKSLERDPEAALYHAAWLAGWGPATTRREGNRLLDAAAAGEGDLAILAHRLRLRDATLNLNVEEYVHGLEWLTARRADRVGDEVKLWRLLVVVGRRSEAEERIRNFSTPPATAEELVELAGTMAKLDLASAAAARLERGLATFGGFPAVWISLARLDLQLRRWPELRDLAASLRSRSDLEGSLNGFSLFLTGAADAGAGRREPAAQAFEAAAATPAWEPALALQCASRIQSFGFPAEATALLRRVAGPFAKRADFWFAFSRAAYASKDAATVLETATKAYELAPDSRGAANNYAAALLLTRQDPALALQLILELRRADPADPALAVNQALALLQNGRLEEGAALLRASDSLRLDAGLVAAVGYGWAEYHLHRGAAAEAKAAYEGVNPGFLFPVQQQWYAEQSQALADRR